MVYVSLVGPARNSQGVVHKRSLPQTVTTIPDLRSNLATNSSFTGRGLAPPDVVVSLYIKFCWSFCLHHMLFCTHAFVEKETLMTIFLFIYLSLLHFLHLFIYIKGICLIDNIYDLKKKVCAEIFCRGQFKKKT